MRPIIFNLYNKDGFFGNIINNQIVPIEMKLKPHYESIRNVLYPFVLYDDYAKVWYDWAERLKLGEECSVLWGLCETLYSINTNYPNLCTIPDFNSSDDDDDENSSNMENILNNIHASAVSLQNNQENCGSRHSI